MEEKKIRFEEIGFGGLKLLQSNEGFRFGIDAVIVADFAARLCPHAVNIIDLGTGNGIIPFILSHKTESCNITGIDVQEKAIELALESRKVNGLESRIEFICCDVLDIDDKYPGFKGTADCVVSNPPYVEKGSGMEGSCRSRMIARQETTADIEGFISAAASLLKERGSLFLVHRPSRLVDIFYYCRKHRLEPKNIRFVSPSEGKIPNIVLIHCILGGGHELNHLEPLYVYDSEGNYTSEIMEIYEKIC